MLARGTQVGTQTLYWSLPSEQAAKRRRTESQLEAKLGDAEGKSKALGARHEELQAERVPSEERTEQLAELAELRGESTTLEAQCAEHADTDPEYIEQIRGASTVCADAANRWTDNIFTLAQKVSLQTGMRQGELLKAWRIDEEKDLEFL